MLKDEKKHHGTVDESSSEQQFHKSNVITFVVCEKFRTIFLVLVGLTADSQTKYLYIREVGIDIKSKEAST